MAARRRRRGPARQLLGPSYDDNGNQVGIGYPGGMQASYTFDYADRQQTLDVQVGVDPPRSIVSSAGYLPSGPLNSLTLGNGVVETRLFDSRYFPDLIDVAGHKTRTWDYQTDDVGNVTQIDEVVACSSSDLVLDNRTVSSTEVFESCGALTVGPDFQVLAPGDVTLRAVHRWYQSARGAYSRPDPLGWEFGDSNVYQYAAGSPIVFSDPLGLAIVVDASLEPFVLCARQARFFEQAWQWFLNNGDWTMQPIDSFPGRPLLFGQTFPLDRNHGTPNCEKGGRIFPDDRTGTLPRGGRSATLPSAPRLFEPSWLNLLSWRSRLVIPG